MKNDSFLKHFMSSFVMLMMAAFLAGCASSPSLEEVAEIPLALKAAPPEYDTLLQKYVSTTGVDYQTWSRHSEDRKALQKVARFYAQTRPPVENEQALAWYLNAYNALILEQILNHWPNKGPLNASLLFFHARSITVSGRKMSFQTLEQKIIRPRFQDPRIHFALNCASRSCPPLFDQAFRKENLKVTLDRLTRDFLNDNAHAFTVTEEGIALSKIFEWYEEDFGGRDQLIPYINSYRNEPLPLDSKISFQKYDWTLNQAE